MSISIPEIRGITEAEVGLFQQLLYGVLDELHPKHPEAVASYRQQFSQARILADLEAGRGTYLLANLDGVPCGIGVGYSRGGIAFLFWIGVLPDFRKRGIGRLLLHALHTQFRNWECRKSELFAYQHFGYLKEFYENEGYKVVAEIPNHYFGLDVTYFVCDL